MKTATQKKNYVQPETVKHGAMNLVQGSGYYPSKLYYVTLYYYYTTLYYYH